MSDHHPLLPPFTQETAARKVRGAEDAWNSRDPERVSLAYTRGQPLAQPRASSSTAARRSSSS